MKIASVLLLVFCLSGCTHLSNIKKESGTVVAVQYKAPIDQEIDGHSYNSDHGTTWHTQTIKEDEKFMVVFKCDHGVVFSINNADVFAKVKPYDKVVIFYKERLTSDSQIVDFKFIDANPIN